jgi:hypothetical protein
MDIESLKPSERLRVMDLVSAAGIDVSDWKNFKGGKEKAASNPKYCYEWSYEDHDKQLIVLNLWYDNLDLSNGEIIQRLNLREAAKNAASSPQSKRATNMDFSLQKAARLNWPLRVIICDGTPRDDSVNRTKSSAERRVLDYKAWHIKSYDSKTGNCVVVRGEAIPNYIDQFEQETLPEGGVSKKVTTTQVFERNPQVRKYVLERAQGYCEWCGAKGFVTSAGSIYLETHHIQPLSENGDDSVSNVIALCPNHHREAHYGENSEKFKNDLFECIKNRTRRLNQDAPEVAPVSRNVQ